MKGKSLQLLIDELNKAERHQVLNSCKRSGDKRHKVLYELMKSSYSGKREFSELLDKHSGKLYEKKYTSAEQDKIQRRFIDFAVKEIENIKIKNFLGENPAERNHLLSKIYEKNPGEIFQRYVQKSAELSKNKNREIYADAIDRQIVFNSSSHTKKEISGLRNLLIIKNTLIQKNYHGELSRIYELLSLLDFEDKELTEELKPLILHDNEVEMLIGLSAGSPEEIIYLLSKARFQFYETKKFNELIHRAETAVKKLQFHEEYKKLLSKIAIIKSLHGFHFGETASSLAEMTKPLADTEDEIQLFYYHLFRVLVQASKDRLKADPKEVQKLKFSAGNEFRKDFLLALISFSRKDQVVAIKKIQDLSYHDNPQISAWSKILEIKIHLEKGNTMLCESLINRLKRALFSSKNKHFTLNSSHFSLKMLNSALIGKWPEKPGTGITCLHSFLLSLDKTPKSN